MARRVDPRRHLAGRFACAVHREWRRWRRRRIGLPQENRWRTGGSARQRPGRGPFARQPVGHCRWPWTIRIPRAADWSRPIPRQLGRQGLTILGREVAARREACDCERTGVRLNNAAGIFDLDRGTADAMTPESISIGTTWAVSPDGTMVAVESDAGVDLHAVGGGPVRRVPTLTGRERLYGWIRDGLLVSEPQTATQVLAVDPLTGRRQAWKEIQPRDPTGILFISVLVPTPDGRAYAYSWHRALSDLYLVEGLR